MLTLNPQDIDTLIIVPRKWYKKVKAYSLDDLESPLPRDFCSTPSLVHSCVDMFISNHECRNMLIT
jgi:hypothetical protein